MISQPSIFTFARRAAAALALLAALWAVPGLASGVSGSGASGSGAGDAKGLSAAIKQQVPPPVENSDAYIIGPEDVLSIVTRNVPEMSGDFLITYDGTMNFPVVGQVHAAGMTPLQLKSYLEAGLSKELRDPEVTVNIKQFHPNRIYIYGAVERAGVYDYRKGWRISELVASAGGLSAPPERLTCVIFRAGSPTQKIPLRRIFVDADDAADVPVASGDSVNIQPEPTVRVNVVGEVRLSGMHELYEGQGAVEALAAAGGENDRAALSRAKLSRHGQDIPVDLFSAVIDGDTAKNVTVEDGDTLYIPQQYAQISVTGMVERPGAQVLPDGREWTMSRAIAEAGGSGPRAKTNGAQLIRVGPDGKAKTTVYDLKRLGTPGEPDPVLQDKDVVFIPQSGAPSVNDFSTFGNLYWILRTFVF